MRIALLTRNFSRTAGGAESYAIAIAKQLAMRHEVHVFCQETDDPVPKAICHRVWRPFKRPRWLNQIVYAWATWWMTRKGFDVVHSHEHVFHGDIQTLHVQPVAKGIWGQRTGWRRLLRTLSVWTSPRRLTYLWLEAARMKPQKGRHLVFASHDLLQQFLRYYPDIAPRSVVIEPGVELPTQAPAVASIKAQLGWDSDRTWWLFVANDYHRKGLDALLHAMTELPPEHQLVVVGQTRQLGAYQTMVQKLGLQGRVHFWGPRNDIAELMCAADALVHPTLEDSFGMVVLEAMAQGLPVLVSASPYCGLSAHLTHLSDAWLLNNPKDAPALANAMQALWSDPTLRQSLINGGHQQAQGRTWHEAALKYEKLLPL
jgi:UDP-glucose:(heptosyl)LPS alpha-1,3-glucosyltransferase